jgi:hypothetical protein
VRYLTRQLGQTLFSAIALASFSASEVIAQPVDADISAESLQVQPRVGLRYTTEGAGFEPFTNFEVFLPLVSEVENHLPFFTGRVFLDPQENVGGNVTFGYRNYNDIANQILGGYLSLDVRNTGNITFEQLGAGFEWLTPGWDLRLNGYLPISDQRIQTSEVFSGEASFSGNRLLFDRLRTFDATIAAIDLEFGGKLLAWEGGELRGYAGIYYYAPFGTGNVLGVKGRLVARPTPYTDINLSVQHDSLFDTRVVLSVGVNFPAVGTTGRELEEDSVLARIAEPLQRENVMLIDQQTFSDQTEAFSVASGELFNFLFVDLTGDGGNGTFENPYLTLSEAIASASANDIIYVFNNGTISPFTIPDRVQILSSGPVQVVDTIQLGNFTLPLSGSGNFPTVTGDVGAGNGVVTLGNNTVLSGFQITVSDESTSGDGIRGIIGQNVSNVDINNNTVANAIGEGIYLNNVTGTAIITNNTVTDTRNNSNAGFSELNGAILVNNSVGGLDLQISNNTVETNFALDNVYNVDGIEVSFCRTGVAAIYPGCSGSASATVQISNNTVINRGTVVSGEADGIDINLDTNVQMDITIGNNTVQNMPDKGISFGSVNSGVLTSGTISNNVIQNTFGEGINISLENDSTFNSLTISSNQITNGFENKGIDVQLENNAVMSSLVLSNNTLTNIFDDGIRIEVLDDANLSATVSGNQISDVTDGKGIDVQLENNGIINNLILSNNTITNIFDDGIRFEAIGNANLTATISGNQISNITDGRGIDVQLDGDAIATLIFSNNTIANTFIDGIRLVTETDSTLFTTLTNNTVSNANSGGGEEGGIWVRSRDSSRICLRMENNTSSNNTGDGFQLRNQSNMELFGIIADVTNDAELETALIGFGNSATGNTGTNFNQRNNDLIVPTAACTFP